VQAKVGTTKFSLVYNQIRQSALGVRRNRKVARALQVTTNPEAAAKRKIQRNVIKKDSRKRKDSAFSYVSLFFYVKCFSNLTWLF
jgi:U3 small nucleolar RNA-associated protein 20